jgi:hypothetical protein
MPHQTDSNPERSAKAQVPIRLTNKGKVQAMKKQDMPLIHQAFLPKNGKHSVTVVLDDGDLNIQSASRNSGALEKEWHSVSESEVIGFLSKRFQEVYLTSTINAFAITSDKPLLSGSQQTPRETSGASQSCKVILGLKSRPSWTSMLAISQLQSPQSKVIGLDATPSCNQVLRACSSDRSASLSVSPYIYLYIYMCNKMCINDPSVSPQTRFPR